MANAEQRSVPLSYAGRSWITRFTGLASLAFTLEGCTRSASTNVLGAYYPDWLFCMTGALLITALVRVLLLRAGLEDWLDPKAVAYPAMACVLAFSSWLLFFSRL